jgi:hypothetical protein
LRSRSGRVGASRVPGEPHRQAIRPALRGVHFEETDEISIEGESSNVILDGETFRAERGSPIRLNPGAAAVVRPARGLKAVMPSCASLSQRN